MKKCLNTLPVALIASMMLIGCAGEDGNQGPAGNAGAQGPAGADGTNALVSTTMVAAGEDCANGGIQVDSGLDTNGDGALGETEITDTMFICNGADGQMGINALVSTAVEAAGDNCAVGGVMIQVGLDTNGDGVLDAGEVLSTQYVCNGEAGEDFMAYSYVGNNGVSCGGCHEGTVDEWMGSGHQMALASLEGEDADNGYCLQCHTTGWDSDMNFGDTEITNPGPDNSGYDDFWMDDSEEGAMRRAALEGVQCESCHGSMGPGIYNHDPAMSFATRDDLAICGSCHHGQMEEWATSGHSQAIANEGSAEAFTEHFNRTYCWSCHTSEGFVATYDPNWAGLDPSDFETLSMVGCVTCHDPHIAANEETNPAQLRVGALIDYPVIYDPDGDGRVYTGYGNSQLCAQCHHARRDNDNVQGQIDNGYAHFGPHYSNQADMFVGDGSYEIDGYEYDRDYMHNQGGLALGCVDCHFPTVESHGRDHMVHNLEIAWESCDACHGDTQAFVAGVQDEIDGLMEDLITAIGVPFDSLKTATGSTVDQRKAGYAYAFVYTDHSHGAHNPSYARSLLNNAIDFMTTMAAQ